MSVAVPYTLPARLTGKVSKLERLHGPGVLEVDDALLLTALEERRVINRVGGRRLLGIAMLAGLLVGRALAVGALLLERLGGAVTVLAVGGSADRNTRLCDEIRGHELQSGEQLRSRSHLVLTLRMSVGVGMATATVAIASGIAIMRRIVGVEGVC